MGFLTDYENGEVEFQGKHYPVDLAYDTVLNVQRMYREKLLDDADLILESLRLFRIPEKIIEKTTWQERQDLLEKICREKIAVRKRPRVGKQQRLFDFEDDGEYIYASFLQAYGLDLIEQQGKLPWQRKRRSEKSCGSVAWIFQKEMDGIRKRSSRSWN